MHSSPCRAGVAGRLSVGGTYHRVVNRKAGPVIGTQGRTNDADIGNRDVPAVTMEDAGAAADKVRPGPGRKDGAALPVGGLRVPAERLDLAEVGADSAIVRASGAPAACQRPAIAM